MSQHLSHALSIQLFSIPHEFKPANVSKCRKVVKIPDKSMCVQGPRNRGAMGIGAPLFFQNVKKCSFSGMKVPFFSGMKVTLFLDRLNYQ